MLTDAQLRQKATSSSSLLVDVAVWYQLARAEVLSKLTRSDERQRMRKLASRRKQP